MFSRAYTSYPWRPIYVLADVSDAACEAPIEVDESDLETLREKSADRALAGSAGANQSNLLGTAHVTRTTYSW